ncbi:hypothetical protein SNE40_012891 [Patella caerulea]|uniref:Uncharacterized protein n=1 Tax=Patella caerulea TaxID=87958 RepID=A0AAN8JNE7_PATCE
METCIASSSSKRQHRIFRMARLLIVIIALVVLAASISAQDEDREKRYMYPGGGMGGIGGGMMCIRANMPCTPGGMNGRRCCVGMCTYSGMGYRCSMMG